MDWTVPPGPKTCKKICASCMTMYESPNHKKVRRQFALVLTKVMQEGQERWTTHIYRVICIGEPEQQEVLRPRPTHVKSMNPGPPL